MSGVFVGKANNSIRLRSGKYLDLLYPRSEDFEFRDILSICRICRYGGHCDRWYSVGEHSIHAANIAKEMGLPLDGQRAVFGHDFTEAFLSDMVKPLKVAMSDYQVVERRHEIVIGAKLDIDFDKWHDTIKQIDIALLIAEKNILFRPDGVRWYHESEALSVVFEPKFWSPEECETKFLEKARELALC